MPTTPNFSQPAIFSEVATPTAPDSGYLKVYGNSGVLCSIANSGTAQSYLTSSSATSTYLPLAGGTLTGDLKFTDATYDIGKSGATRPRDGFFSRNVTVGNTLTLSGTYAYYNPAIVLSGGGGISVQSVLPFYFSNTEYCRIYNGQFQTIGNFGIGAAADSPDVIINRDAAGIFAQRNGTNAQTFRIYNTYTSSTSYETLNLKGKAAANFEIGPENGSAGGTLRGLTLGGYTAGSATITPWLSFTSSGNASFSQYATIQGGVLVEAGGSYTTSYASPAQVRVRRAQGTQASPTQVTTGVQLGIIGAQGLNNAGAYAGYTSYISFNAGENITTTGCGGYFNFYTTPVGSLTEVMRTWIGAAGNFGIGVFAAEPSTLLTINGDMLRLTTAKTPATSSSTANQGEIGWDASSLYVAPATNTWKRTPVIGFSTGTSCVPAFVVDRYYSGYASQNLSTQAMTANVLTFIPINIPYTFSATRIGINVTTAVAGGARLGIYNDIGGVPSGTPLLDAGTVDIGTTGEKEITITQSLVTGVYWLAVVTNSAATLTAENLGTDGVSVPNLGSATGAGNSITHLTQSHTYAALPTVGTLTAATTKTPPRVWLRNVVASPSPTFVASSVNKSYPSGIAAGDIIVLYLASGSAPALPSGFTNLGTQVASLYDRACYKVASGSETGVISTDTIVCCLVIRGGSSANIAFSFSATHTVAAANSLVAVLGWSDGDGGPGIDVTAPVGWTRRANTTPASPGSVVLTLDALRAAGSYTHTVSFSGSYSSGGIVFSIG